MAKKKNSGENLHWMKWYTADYLKSETVSALNKLPAHGQIPADVVRWAARGIYDEFLMRCFDSGSIPGETDRLRLMTGLDADLFSVVWAAMSSRFVPTDNGRLINKRVQIELDDAKSRSITAKTNGSLGAAEKKRKADKATIELGLCHATENCSDPIATLKPSQANQNQNQNQIVSTPTTSAAKEILFDEFERWIALYPNQVRVNTAAQAWLSLMNTGEITEATLAEVFAGLERWKRSAEWAREKGKYIPAPSVFLLGNERNAGRMWRDNPPEAEEFKAEKPKFSSDGRDPNTFWVRPKDWVRDSDEDEAA